MAREPLPYVSEFLEPRLLLAGTASAQEGLNSARPPLFVENLGQWPSEIRYLLKSSGATVLMTDRGPVFHLLQERVKIGPSPDPLADLTRFAQSREFLTDSFSVRFEGANVVRPRGADRRETFHNYYIGDASTWRTNVPTFGSVVYPNLYHGIDLHTWGKSGSLKYEFHLAPGADPRQIRLRYDGVDSLQINQAGQLVAGTSLGDVIDDAPVVYQSAGARPSIVDSRFCALSAMTVGFDLGFYDATRPLIIDPNVVWSRYVGGTSTDFAVGLAADSSHDAIITGRTSSTNFAGMTGHNGGSWDAFVAKVRGNGSFAWATYLGGNGLDYGSGLAIDSLDNALVTGFTDSTNFAGVGGFQGLPRDAFVAKLGGLGALIWARYLGGNTDDFGVGIATDSFDAAIVAGLTSSTNLAGVTGNNGGYDAFVAKFSSGGVFAWARYIGGGASDQGMAIATDGANDVLTTGFTSSTNFAGMPGYNGGARDVFVAKMSGVGGALTWARYLGGTGTELGTGIATDSAGDALLTGWTDSSPFAGTTGYNGGVLDGFVAKFSANGAFVRATYLGGGGEDRGWAIATDSAGDALVTGQTDSQPFAGATNYNGGSRDAFAAKVRGSGAAAGTTAWAIYLGGSDSERGFAISTDGAGDAFIAGETDSANFTAALNNLTSLGSDDAFVTKLAIEPEVLAANFVFCGLPFPATHELYFDFSEDVSASLTNTDLVLLNTTTNTLVPTGFITLDSYNPTLNRATFSFPGFTPTGFPPGVLPDGRYQATFVPGGVTDLTGNALPPNYVFNFFFLMGDANHDGVVNLLDFNILASPVNFGQSPRHFCDGDFNYDGTVNLTDFNILATRFGNRI